MKTQLLNRNSFKSEAEFITALRIRKSYQAKQNKKLNIIASVVVVALFCIAIIAGI